MDVFTPEVVLHSMVRQVDDKTRWFRHGRPMGDLSLGSNNMDIKLEQLKVEKLRSSWSSYKLRVEIKLEQLQVEKLRSSWSSFKLKVELKLEQLQDEELRASWSSYKSKVK